MKRKTNLQKEQRMRIQDIPLIATMGELAQNIIKSHEIMKAIHEGRTNDAFNIAKEILNSNDAIIERQTDKSAIMKIIEDSNNHIIGN